MSVHSSLPMDAKGWMQNNIPDAHKAHELPNK